MYFIVCSLLFILKRWNINVFTVLGRGGGVFLGGDLLKSSQSQFYFLFILIIDLMAAKGHL